jgi:hypothetical protein
MNTVDESLIQFYLRPGPRGGAGGRGGNPRNRGSFVRGGGSKQ